MAGGAGRGVLSPSTYKHLPSLDNGSLLYSFFGVMLRVCSWFGLSPFSSKPNPNKESFFCFGFVGFFQFFPHEIQDGCVDILRVTRLRMRLSERR